MENKESKRGRKLYYYLSRFTEKELLDFHAYLSSSLLGNSPQFARMLLTIQKEVLGTERTNIDADLFQEEFCPQGELDEKKIKYIRIRIVQMHEKLLDFLSFMDYRADPNAKDIHMLKALYTRGWDKYFLKTHAEVEKKPPYKWAGEYHIYKLWRAIVLNDYLTEAADSGTDTKLKEVLQLIEVLDLCLRLKYGSAATGSLRYAKTNIPQFDSEALFARSTQPEFALIEEVNIYYLIFNLNLYSIVDNKKAIGFYHSLRELLRNPEKYDSSEALEGFSACQNFIIINSLCGEFEYLEEMKGIIKELLKSNIFLKKGGISSAHFTVTINLLRQMGEMGWAESFAEEWKSRVIGDQNLITYHVLSAANAFEKGQYSKTIEILYARIPQFPEKEISLRARLFICHSLWKLREYEWLRSNILSTRQYLLRSNDFEKSRKNRFLVQLRMFLRICNAKTGNPDQAEKKYKKIIHDLSTKAQHRGIRLLSEITEQEIKLLQK